MLGSTTKPLTFILDHKDGAKRKTKLGAGAQVKAKRCLGGYVLTLLNSPTWYARVGRELDQYIR